MSVVVLKKGNSALSTTERYQIIDKFQLWEAIKADPATVLDLAEGNDSFDLDPEIREAATFWAREMCFHLEEPVTAQKLPRLLDL